MNDVIVNKGAIITEGNLKGMFGWVVDFDNNKDKVSLELLDNTTIVQVSSENIRQEMEYKNVQCDCGIIYSIKITENDKSNTCHHCSSHF